MRVYNHQLSYFIVLWLNEVTGKLKVCIWFSTKMKSSFKGTIPPETLMARTIYKSLTYNSHWSWVMVNVVGVMG